MSLRGVLHQKRLSAGPLGFKSFLVQDDAAIPAQSVEKTCFLKKMRLPLGRERKAEVLEAERLPPASAGVAMTFRW